MRVYGMECVRIGILFDVDGLAERVELPLDIKAFRLQVGVQLFNQPIGGEHVAVRVSATSLALNLERQFHSLNPFNA